jgi:hypothetical protein
MSGRSRLVGLAIAVALLASGVANKASADLGACKPVKACTPVKAAPVVPVCKPVKQLPAPAACKPVKADANTKYVALRDRIARFTGHFKRHDTGKEVYYDAPKPVPSHEASPTPAPAPKPPTT